MSQLVTAALVVLLPPLLPPALLLATLLLLALPLPLTPLAVPVLLSLLAVLGVALLEPLAGGAEPPLLEAPAAEELPALAVELPLLPLPLLLVTTQPPPMQTYPFEQGFTLQVVVLWAGAQISQPSAGLAAPAV